MTHRTYTGLLFIIKENVKTWVRERRWDGVGIMKDKEMKLDDVECPHTLCGSWYILFEYIDPVEVGPDIRLVEVKLRKLRNLFVCVSEEREDGGGGKGRERARRHYLCRQVHIGYTAVSPIMQGDCLWLSCENRGT